MVLHNELWGCLLPNAKCKSCRLCSGGRRSMWLGSDQVYTIAMKDPTEGREGGGKGAYVRQMWAGWRKGRAGGGSRRACSAARRVKTGAAGGER